MKSIHAFFDHKKTTGLEDANDHDQPRFENKIIYVDMSNFDTPNTDHFVILS